MRALKSDARPSPRSAGATWVAATGRRGSSSFLRLPGGLPPHGPSRCSPGGAAIPTPSRKWRFRE
eukprot:10639919-Alexandrium_andersonii.AAC.1